MRIEWDWPVCNSGIHSKNQVHTESGSGLLEWIQDAGDRFWVDKRSVDVVKQAQAEAETEHSQDNQKEINKTTKVFPKL